jgi:hypothetical protein
VRVVVERFYDAVRAERGAEACAELSSSAVEELQGQSGQRCAQAITRLTYKGGDIVDAEVFAFNGKVELENGESAFLSRETAGWKLSAIGCTPKGKPRDRPFDCELEA